MARFRADEAEHYGGQGGAGFFSLRNDKEVAEIRILYNGIEDVEGLSVHEVKVNDKKRYVNCLREYNQPIDDCPFCRDHYPTQAKLFVPVYNVKEDKVQIWERGKKFFSKMSSLCSRYQNLVSHVFEVERNGKPHDTGTTYESFEIDQDDTSLEDFDVPEIVGGVVLDKTAEDMEYYLESGEFPPTDDDEEEPIRRRDSVGNERRERGRDREQRQNTRRTPASSRRSSGNGNKEEF